MDLLCFDPATNRKLLVLSFYETKTDKEEADLWLKNKDNPPTPRLNTLNPNSPLPLLLIRIMIALLFSFALNILILPQHRRIIKTPTCHDSPAAPWIDPGTSSKNRNREKQANTGYLLIRIASFPYINVRRSSRAACRSDRYLLLFPSRLASFHPSLHPIVSCEQKQEPMSSRFNRESGSEDATTQRAAGSNPWKGNGI